jgi:hypothetical protein
MRRPNWLNCGTAASRPLGTALGHEAQIQHPKVLPLPWRGTRIIHIDRPRIPENGPLLPKEGGPPDPGGSWDLYSAQGALKHGVGPVLPQNPLGVGSAPHSALGPLTYASGAEHLLSVAQP